MITFSQEEKADGGAVRKVIVVNEHDRREGVFYLDIRTQYKPPDGDEFLYTKKGVRVDGSLEGVANFVGMIVAEAADVHGETAEDVLDAVGRSIAANAGPKEKPKTKKKKKVAKKKGKK